MLNHEQSIQLKKNLIRDAKDSKSTSVALVSESLPLAPRTSSIVITELDDTNSEDLSETYFDESFALLTNTFRRFARKSNFQKKKPLAITDKPKTRHQRYVITAKAKAIFLVSAVTRRTGFSHLLQLPLLQKMTCIRS